MIARAWQCFGYSLSGKVRRARTCCCCEEEREEEERPTKEPSFRPFLYVDEETQKYYYHTPGSTMVTSVVGHGLYEGFREDEDGATLRWDGEKDGFEDDKLCRVRRENEDLGITAQDHARELFLQEEDGNQQFWFELSWRFGIQLSMDKWSAARDQLTARGRRIVKIIGYNGGIPIADVPWESVSQELNAKADVIIWDGAWYSPDGWTKLIPEFLRGSSERLAVAFQKEAEVPGFHREYWHAYKEFPGRVWVVVLPDDFGSFSKEVSVQVSAQVAWLEEQVRLEKLKKDWVQKYVGVAMSGRAIQGPAPVVAINGGGVAIAQAAIDLMRGDVSVPWTVFSGQRVGIRDNRADTLIGFLERNPGLPNVTFIR